MRSTASDLTGETFLFAVERSSTWDPTRVLPELGCGASFGTCFGASRVVRGRASGELIGLQFWCCSTEGTLVDGSGQRCSRSRSTSLLMTLSGGNLGAGSVAWRHQPEFRPSGILAESECDLSVLEGGYRDGRTSSPSVLLVLVAFFLVASCGLGGWRAPSQYVGLEVGADGSVSLLIPTCDDSTLEWVEIGSGPAMGENRLAWLDLTSADSSDGVVRVPLAGLVPPAGSDFGSDQLPINVVVQFSDGASPTYFTELPERGRVGFMRPRTQTQQDDSIDEYVERAATDACRPGWGRDGGDDRD